VGLVLAKADLPEGLVELPIRQETKQGKVPLSLAADSAAFTNDHDSALGINRAAVRELNFGVAGRLNSCVVLDADRCLSLAGKGHVGPSFDGIAADGEPLAGRVVGNNRTTLAMYGEYTAKI